MVINHKIPLSVIRRGDHIYVRGGFFKKMQRQGIIVADVDFSRREQWLVIRPRQKKYNEDFELCLVTLIEFLYPQLNFVVFFMSKVMCFCIIGDYLGLVM
jgi:hypothetical protein